MSRKAVFSTPFCLKAKLSEGGPSGLASGSGLVTHPCISMLDAASNCQPSRGHEITKQAAALQHGDPMLDELHVVHVIVDQQASTSTLGTYHPCG